MSNEESKYPLAKIDETSDVFGSTAVLQRIISGEDGDYDKIEIALFGEPIERFGLNANELNPDNFQSALISTFINSVKRRIELGLIDESITAINFVLEVIQEQVSMVLNRAIEYKQRKMEKERDNKSFILKILYIKSKTEKKHIYKCLNWMNINHCLILIWKNFGIL